MVDKSNKEEEPTGVADWFRRNALIILTVGAVILGTVIGVACKYAEPSNETIRLIGFPGEILLRMLKCIIIPLVVSSLITGLSTMDVRQSGRMGALAILYYMVTTVIAVITGIALVIVIHPGNPDAKNPPNEQKNVSTVSTLLDLLRNMFPDNLVHAAIYQVQTTGVNNKTNDDLLGNKDGMNTLGLITICVAFGIILTQIENARTMVKFFSILDRVSMRLVSLIMWYSPIGILSLIMKKVLDVESLAVMFKNLLLYFSTVMLGLIIHSTLTLPLIYFFSTRKNPLVFVRGLLQALATAFGTASSAATLPMTFECLENNLSIDRRVTRFILPVGATINMDGTALYEAVASIFIGQQQGYEMTLARIIIISLTATLASIGAAAVPQAGQVTMLMVLTAAGLPADISMILTVDWLLDRFRTTVNVLGDAYGAGIVHHCCQESLPPPSADQLPEQMNGPGADDIGDMKKGEEGDNLPNP